MTDGSRLQAPGFTALTLLVVVGRTGSAWADREIVDGDEATVAPPPELICAAQGQPVPVGVRDAAFDAERGACFAPEVALRVSGAAAIDTADFYGTIGVGFAAGFRLPVGRRLELGAALHGARVTFAQDAVVKDFDTAIGPVVATAAYALAAGDRARAAVVASLVLPDFDGAATELGGQLAVIRSMAVSPRWVIHARAAVIAEVASSAGGTTDREAIVMGADAVVAATGRLAFGLGADAQAGWRGGFDQFLVRPGLRFAAGRTAHVELAGGIVVGGQERVDAAVTLGVVLAD